MALTTGEDDSERDRLDALRRRVYGPGATDADRAEYAALLARTAAADPPAVESDPRKEPDPEVSPPPPRRLRLTPILIGASGIVVLGLAVLATTIARSDAPSPDVDRSVASSRAELADATAAPLPTRATLSVDRGVITAQHTSGSGSAVIPLLLDSAPLGSGTLVVSITSPDPDPVGWAAQRHQDGFHDAGALVSVASSAPALRDAAAAPSAARYTGAPPSQITVRAPAGIRWSLTVAFTP